MTYIRNPFFFFLLYLLSICPLAAQQIDAISKLQSFVSNIHIFNQLYPQEKVWLHCDNTAYFQGDTIWFKAYTVAATNLQPADLSRVLYVELLSPEGEVISTQQLQIEKGECHGQIPLVQEIEQMFINQKKKFVYYPTNPHTDNYYIPLPSGYYEIRAYTRSMLNWANEICFSRIFPVYNSPEREGDYSQPTMDTPKSSKKQMRPTIKTRKKVNVDFYPEGGYLVKGIPSRIAFKVSDKEGNSLIATGQLLVNEKIISNFSTTHDGMGSFYLLPQDTISTFNIYVKGKKYTFDLPEIKNEGAVLSADISNEDTLQISIAATPTVQTDTLGISIVCRGKPVYFKELYSLTSDFITLPGIPIHRLPIGVNQITLFNKEGKIYAERLVFILDSLSIASTQPTYIWNSKTYTPFAPIKLKIKFPGETLPQSCSVAIRDGESDIITTYEDNLPIYLLLTSDLKGYIHHPAYYFESRDSLHKQALDLLMLTQGWRRYEWKQMAGVFPFNPKHFIEKGLTLDGQILHPKKKNPLQNIKVSVYVSQDGKPLQQGYIITDKEGRFRVDLETFYETKTLSISVSKEKKLLNSRILLNRHFSPQPRTYNLSECEICSMPQPRISINSFSLTGSNILSDVAVNKKKKKKTTFICYNIKKENEKALDEGRSLTNYTVLDYLKSLYIEISEDGRFFNNIPTLFTYKVGKKEFKNYNDGIENSKNTFLDEVDYIIDYDDYEAHHYISFVQRVMPSLKAYKTFSVWAYKRAPQIQGLRNTPINGYSKIVDYYHPQYNRKIIPGEIDYRRTLY